MSQYSPKGTPEWAEETVFYRAEHKETGEVTICRADRHRYRDTDPFTDWVVTFHGNEHETTLKDVRKRWCLREINI
jgi:hypothetical protein